MIESAEEFVHLRTSEVQAEYYRAARDSASVSTWLDVIERYPEMREWVAHNKTVPLEILEQLRDDPDERVRWMVLQKRSWARAHPDDTNRAGDLTNARGASRKSKASERTPDGLQ